MVTAKRHTNKFYRKNDRHDRCLPLACCLPAPAGVLRHVPAALSSPPTDVETTHIRTTDIVNQETSPEAAPELLPVLDGMAMARALRRGTALSLVAACLCG